MYIPISAIIAFLTVYFLYDTVVEIVRRIASPRIVSPRAKQKNFSLEPPEEAIVFFKNMHITKPEEIKKAWSSLNETSSKQSN